MRLERNMGRLDRIVRGVAGIWLLALAVSAVFDDRRTTAVTAAIAGGGLIGNAASGYCGGNSLLGIDTSSITETDDGACSGEVCSTE